MNKNHKNLLLVAGVLATGLTVIAPQSAFADNDKADKTERKMDKDNKGSFKSNVRVSLDNTQVVYNGVTYTVSGSLHGTAQVKSKQGDRTSIKLHLNAQGIKLTAPDGTTFNGVGAINAQVRTDDDGATFKLVGNVGLIGQGKAPNFRLKVNLRGNVETDQNVTMTLEDATIGA